MEGLTFYQLILTFIGLCAFAVAAITFFGMRIADKYPSDVRITWYLISLSAVCTFIMALWASAVGAIDKLGVFQGRWGETLNLLLRFMLDLETDINILAALFAIVIVPQVTTYFLSGLFGCASAPILVGRAVSFFVWSIVKSFAVSSGILLTLGVFGLARGWASWTAKGAFSMLSFSLMLLLMAFGCLYMYREMHHELTESTVIKLTTPALRVQSKLSRLHAWFTRHSRRR